MTKFLQNWYDSHKEDVQFKTFIAKHETEIDESLNGNRSDFDEYYGEVFNGILKKEYSETELFDSRNKHKILEELVKKYRKELASVMEYSYWFTQYSTASEDIHSFLSELMNNKNPSQSYIFLADLFVNHMFSVAFTTNFDDLLAESLSLLGVRSKEIWFEADISGSSLSKTSPNIVKLHGDYMYENTKNFVSETRRLSRPLQNQMENVLSKGGLIIVGYSGGDNSIMYTLEMLSEKYSFPLFWCEMEDKIHENKINWRVKNLVMNGSNAFFVPIKNFDSLVDTFWNNYTLYAKMRRNRWERKDGEYRESIYEEEYLKNSLLRIKEIIDKVIEKNIRISETAVPVPPPDESLFLKSHKEGDEGK